MITLQFDVDIEDEEVGIEIDGDEIQDALDNMFGFGVLKVVAVRMLVEKS